MGGSMTLDTYFGTMAQVLPAIVIAFLIEYRSLTGAALRTGVGDLPRLAPGRPTAAQVGRALLRYRAVILPVVAAGAFGVGEVLAVFGLFAGSPMPVLDLTSPAWLALRDQPPEARNWMLATGVLVAAGVLMAVLLVGFVDRIRSEFVAGRAFTPEG